MPILTGCFNRVPLHYNPIGMRVVQPGDTEGLHEGTESSEEEGHWMNLTLRDQRETQDCDLKEHETGNRGRIKVCLDLWSSKWPKRKTTETTNYPWESWGLGIKGKETQSGKCWHSSLLLLCTRTSSSMNKQGKTASGCLRELYSTDLEEKFSLIDWPALYR